MFSFISRHKHKRQKELQINEYHNLKERGRRTPWKTFICFLQSLQILKVRILKIFDTSVFASIATSPLLVYGVLFVTHFMIYTCEQHNSGIVS